MKNHVSQLLQGDEINAAKVPQKYQVLQKKIKILKQPVLKCYNSVLLDETCSCFTSKNQNIYAHSAIYSVF